MEDRLSKFGYLYQIKIIIALLSDKVFLEQIHEILNEEYFDSEANKWLISTIKLYFERYHSTPTFDVLKIEIKNVDSDILKTTIVEHLKDVHKNFKTPDLEYVKEKTLQFCKNQKLKSAIIKSIDLLKNEQYTDIKGLIDDAMRAGEEKDLGHDYTEHFEDRYNETLRKCIKLPWNVINDITDGGLGAGELGVIVAPSGVGKTWWLAAIGAHAIKQNKKIIHYTLELNAAYTGMRYDAILSGISFQNLKYHTEEIKDVVDKYKNSLIIKQYPTTIASVNTLYAHIKRADVFKFKPDLIIVDYADLLTTKIRRGHENSYFESGTIYEELRGLAGEMEIPIWTASQSQRSSLEYDIVEAQHIAESYKKIMTADFIMSLSRKVEDKIAGTARTHIIKNRFGPDGLTYNTKMNASNGNIFIFDNGTVGSQIEQKKQDQHNEYLRKLLGQKFKEME